MNYLMSHMNFCRYYFLVLRIKLLNFVFFFQLLALENLCHLASKVNVSWYFSAFCHFWSSTAWKMFTFFFFRWTIPLILVHFQSMTTH